MKTKAILGMIAALGMASIQGSEAANLINGAGATFPYPLYSKWISEFSKATPGVQINYQSIGSGGGIRQFLEKTVDFGATDSPMTDEQLSKSEVGVLHVPTALGAVVLTYNMPEIKKPLNLSGEAVAGIFLGTVTKWNDPMIVKLNPGVKLPDEAILVVHRSDGSGTSGIFTDYLSKVSPEWKSKVGSGTAVNWPTGLGGKGNEGVAGLVKQTPGSLGYVELIYAKANGLPYASLMNRAGKTVVPSAVSVTAAAAGAMKAMPADYRVSITDAEGDGSYPISGFTYILVYKEMGKEKGAPIVKFLRWAMNGGQEMAEPLSYARLPKALVTKVQKSIDGISLK